MTMTVPPTGAPRGDSPEQPRTPAGVPSGGQFAAKTLQEADITLDPSASDDVYNQDGDYRFPPFPRSAQQVYDFWSQVKVPDEILSSIQLGYAVMQATEAVDAQHIYRRFPLEWREGKTDQEQLALWDERRGWRKPRLADSMVRPVARVANMYWQAEELELAAESKATDEERAAGYAEAEKLRNWEIVLPNGSKTTPRDLVETYDFELYRWVFRADPQPEWWAGA